MVFVFQGQGGPAQLSAEQERQAAAQAAAQQLKQGITTCIKNDISSAKGGPVALNQSWSYINDAKSNGWDVAKHLNEMKNDPAYKPYAAQVNALIESVEKTWQSKPVEIDKPAVRYEDKVATAAEQVVTQFRDLASIEGGSLRMINVKSEEQFKKEMAGICKEQNVKEVDVVNYINQQKEEYGSCASYFEESQQKAKQPTPVVEKADDNYALNWAKNRTKSAPAIAARGGAPVDIVNLNLAITPQVLQAFAAAVGVQMAPGTNTVTLDVQAVKDFQGNIAASDTITFRKQYGLSASDAQNLCNQILANAGATTVKIIATQ